MYYAVTQSCFIIVAIVILLSKISQKTSTYWDWLNDRVKLFCTVSVYPTNYLLESDEIGYLDLYVYCTYLLSVQNCVWYHLALCKPAQLYYTKQVFHPLHMMLGAKSYMCINKYKEQTQMNRDSFQYVYIIS